MANRRSRTRILNSLASGAAAVSMMIAVTAGMAFASQPAPPVDVEVEAKSVSETEVIAIITVAPNVAIEGGVLRLDLPEGIEVDKKEFEIRGTPKETERFEVIIRGSGNGDFPIGFSLSGKAEDYETAGDNEKRYLIIEDGSAARLVDGLERRRIKHREIKKTLEEGRAKNPEDPPTLGGLTTGKLETVRLEPDVEKRDIKVLVAHPAPGIEEYEKMEVIDRSDDVVKAIDPITVTGRIFYANRAGTVTPLVNATVDIRDSDTGFDEQLTSVITDGNGSFSATVDADDGWFQDGRDIYIRIRTTNSRFRLQDCAGILPDVTYSWSSDVVDSLSDGSTVNFGNLQVSGDNEAAIIFQDLDDGWQFLTSSGAQDPGFVDACWPEGASVYSTFWKELDIEDGDEVARDIVLHEYGHATMHNAYDGYWPSNTGGAHGFGDTNQHPNLAFTEGWGTFIALAVNPDGTYHSNGWSRNIEGFSTGETDGTENEGWVAAGLGDIRDTASDGNCAGGDCDPSGANAPAFSKIWRDAFWRSDSDDVEEYWDRLCGELTSAEHDDAIDSLDFNRIAVEGCICTVEFALVSARSVAGENDVQSVRMFRDLALKNNETGSRIIEVYYRHMGEATRLLKEDPESAKLAASLFRRVGEATQGFFKDPIRTGREKLLDEEQVAAARQLMKLFREKASPEFRAVIEELSPVLDDVATMTIADLRTRMTKEGLKKQR